VVISNKLLIILDIIILSIRESAWKISQDYLGRTRIIWYSN